MFNHLREDLPASLVVFLVALPLCLGIALASGAPLFSGLIAGIVGGIVVGIASGSHTSVSGPAAGLTVIVLGAIQSLGAYDLFLLSVVLAGGIQLILGLLKAGAIGYFVPNSVIKGMLAAIGAILILKQIPHALGYDADYEGDESFSQPGGENTFTTLWQAVLDPHWGAVAISLISLGLLILLERPQLKRLVLFKILPGPLWAVLLGTLLNNLYGSLQPGLQLSGNHLVGLPMASNFNEFIGQFTLPNFAGFGNKEVWTVALTLALVASIESLLSIEAADKLDPYKRITPASRELTAQGLGNVVSGLIGGLPVTAVIVRSSANVNSGARTKMSAVSHGLLLLLAVALIPSLLNLIPKAVLAAVLLQVGYKLIKPTIFKELYHKGIDQILPFVITLVAILVTDLLVGILIGMGVGIYFVIKSNFHSSLRVTQHNRQFLVKLQKDVSFLNKAKLSKELSRIPDGANVLIDGSLSQFIDHDIQDLINDFQISAPLRNITVTTQGMDSVRHKLDLHKVFKS